MSNALAIASVSAVLKDLLNNGLIDRNITGTLGGNVNVTALPPDRISTGNNNEPDQLNLFLYQVTPNQGWRNVGLPSRNSSGDRIDNPPLALDLHYLLTAYGAEEFHSEILLGYAMQLLHETPVLPRDAIRKALAIPSPVTGGILPAALQSLSASDLAEQVEQIKISPEALNPEEISKLWSALYQTHYRPTAAYQVSVVLIESDRAIPSALPVRDRRIYAMPFHQPKIESVRSSAGANVPILADSTLSILGQQLKGDRAIAIVSGIEVTLSAENIHSTKIELPLLPLPLKAGVQAVQVVHLIAFGIAASDPHRGIASNVAAFVLHPKITVSVNPGSVNCQTENGITRCSAEIAVNFTPQVGKRQRVILLLNEYQPVAADSARAYSFSAPPNNGITDPDREETAAIAIPIQGVIAGSYLVRVQVDGAESQLSRNADGMFFSPQVSLP